MQRLRTWTTRLRFLRKQPLHESLFTLKSIQLMARFTIASIFLASGWMWWRDPKNALVMARSRVLSKIVGGMADLTVPQSLRVSFFSRFAQFYEINLEEVKLELTEFRSFRDFFIRELKEGARPQMHDGREDALTSPCDGLIVKAEEVKEGKIEAVKGKAYTVTQFLFGKDDLSSDKNAQRMREQIQPLLGEGTQNKETKLMYTVIYLSPKNYHRFHGPASLFQVESRRHIQGFLELVRPSYLQKHPRVLQTSERVNLFGSWLQGRFIYSAVGALNVGSINLQFEPSFLSNKWRAKEPFAHDMEYSRILSTSLSSTMAPTLHQGSLKQDQYDGRVRVSEKDQLEFDVKDMLGLHPQAETRAGTLPGERQYVLDYSPLLEESLRYNANNLFRASEKEELSFLEKLESGEKLGEGIKDYKITEKGIVVERGQPVGYFNFGSTVVLVFEAQKEWEFAVKEGEPVKMGELLGRNK